MANRTLPELIEATVPADTDLLYLTQGGAPRRMTYANLTAGLPSFDFEQPTDPTLDVPNIVVARSWWYDEENNILNFRNATNTGWIAVTGGAPGPPPAGDDPNAVTDGGAAITDGGIIVTDA